MIPILYKSDEVDFYDNGLGALNNIYDVDVQEQRNGLFTLTASYPVSGRRYKDIEVGRIVLAKPNQNDKAQAFRIIHTELDISGYALTIEADHITYDLTHNLVKSVHLQGNGQNAMTHLQQATVAPHLFRFISDLQHEGDSTLTMVNPMEAIAGTQGSILQIWGGELKRDNRTVSMLSRRGRNNFTSFRLGKNINGLKYTVDTTNIVTRIVPSIQRPNGNEHELIIGDIVDSKNVGNYPNYYMQHVDVADQIKVDENDSDDVIKGKINAYSKNWFTQSANSKIDLPDVTVEIDVTSLQDSADYQDKFKNLEAIELTDSVTVYVPEFGVNVQAVVNELHYDPVAERVTSIVIGTSKLSFADANSNTLKELGSSINKIRENAVTAIVSANGKNTNYYGTEEPAHPVEGDLWFKSVGDETYLMIFKDGRWQEWVSTKTQDIINQAVDDTLASAKEYTDELNEKQASEAAKFKLETTTALNSASADRERISKEATNMTNSAMARADEVANKAAEIDGKVVAVGKSIDGLTGVVNDKNKGLSVVFDLASNGQTLAVKAQQDATSAITTAKGLQTTVNDNKNDLQAQITATAKQVTTEMTDRTNGDKSVRTDMANLIDQRVSSVTSGYQSAISQSADTIMASVSMPNKLINTEFTPDLEGWTIGNPQSGTGNPARINVSNGYKSSNGLRINAYTDNTDDIDAYYQIQQIVKVPSNVSVASLHIMGFIYAISSNDNAYVNANVAPLDSTGKNIGTIVPGAQLFDKTNTTTWQESSSKFINMSIPTGTDSLKISIYARGQTSVNISQPMLVFGNKVGVYTPGAYNNMNTATVLKLAKDNWALGISDNAGRIISGINGDTSGTVIQGKKLVINSDTTINGKAFIDGSVIKNASIGTAQIGKAAIGSAQIINVDVSKISGNIANFITTNVDTLNARVLYGDTGHLTTTDTGLIINKQDDHLQLSSKGQYDVDTKRAQLELLNYADNIDANMQGSLNYYKNPHNNGTGLGIRLLGNQILAIDEAVATGNLYLSPYASGQVQVVNRDRNGFQDIKASKFVTSSERKYKSEINEFNDDALELVNGLNIRRYIKNSEDEIGVIADEADKRILDKTNTGVDLYSFVSVVAKAVQELSAQVKELQSERPNN